MDDTDCSNVNEQPDDSGNTPLEFGRGFGRFFGADRKAEVEPSDDAISSADTGTE